MVFNNNKLENIKNGMYCKLLKMVLKKFEDMKGVTWNRKSKKDKQSNG